VIGALRAELEATFGSVRTAESVGGGCISPSYRIRLVDGGQLFVKTAANGWHADAFAEEARSLEALGATGTLIVPRVCGVSESWLALEWLEPARATESDWRALGSGLARLHRTTAESYGWDTANYIGPLPQRNERAADWPAFWREQRLLPQLQRAEQQLERSTLRDIERLLEELDVRLGAAAEDGPSLLHGDLWSGNVHISATGPGVIDPASYYGHREVDLAMATLFGGFPHAFFDAYETEWPLRPGAPVRRPIYQLYYLLVHVVLFGGGYATHTSAAVRAALA
jgi:fructosamine-3-kinase